MKYCQLKFYIAVPMALFLITLILFYLNIFNRLIFPNPLTILKQLLILTASKKMYSNLLMTLSRVICGTAISIAIGVPFGLFLGYFNRLYHLFEFIIDFCRSIPATALFPLFILFFGISNTSKVIMGAWIATLNLIINTSYGVRHANKAYLKMAKIYKTSRRYVFFHIIFPGALPNICSGLRIAVSLVLIVVIITEMFMGSTNGGIGYAILNAQLEYNIPEMYALIIITGLLGYLLNRLFLSLEKKTIHWTESNSKQ